MAEPFEPQPAPTDEDAADQDAPGDAGPDLSEADRFFVNGKAMPFPAWVEAVMAPVAPRAPAEAEPQPEPAPPDVVWLSRRPAE